MGALDTVVNVGGVNRAGIAYFAVSPSVIGNGQHVGPQSAVVHQGYLAVANNNVNYPAISVLPNGRGVIAMTLVGADYYPSAAYAPVDATGGTIGSVSVAGAGLGPQDGFSEYVAFNGAGTNPPSARPRWGDYGAAVADGDHVVIASEFIGQTCTLQQYEATGFSCGRTRTSLANWYTRISSVIP